MKERVFRGSLVSIINNKLFFAFVIFLVLGLVMVFAGDVVFQQGDLIVDDDLNVTGKSTLELGDLAVLTLGRGTSSIDYGIKFDGNTNDGLLTWAYVDDYFSFQDDVQFPDNECTIFGSGEDSEICYDGSDLVITPDVVGSGHFKLVSGAGVPFELLNTDNTKWSGLNIFNSSDTLVGTIAIGNPSAPTFPNALWIGHRGSKTGDDIVLTTDGTTERMRIKKDGEVNISSISSDGAGKVVCIKSDGSLGTCSDAPNGSGVCTCG